MMKSAAVVIATVLAPTLALANPVEQCYAAAEASNPGYSIAVKVGTTTILPAGVPVNEVMQAIAENHATSGLSLVTNAAGDALIGEVVTCLRENYAPTLSSMWLQKTYPTKVDQQFAVTVTDSGSLRRYQWSELVTCGANTWAMFSAAAANGTECSAWVKAEALGANDFLLSTGVMAGDCENIDCSGSCYGDCDEDGMPHCIGCSGSGTCAEHLGTGTGIRSDSIITVSVD